MTKLISVILFLTFAAFCFADVEEGLQDLERRFHIYMKNCMNKTGVTEDQIITLVNSKQITEEKKVHCFLACMGKSFDVMNASNKFNKLEIEKLIEPLVQKIKMVQNDEVANKITEIIYKCVEEQPDEKDECEAAKKAAQCVIKNVKKILY